MQIESFTYYLHIQGKLTHLHIVATYTQESSFSHFSYSHDAFLGWVGQQLQLFLMILIRNYISFSFSEIEKRYTKIFPSILHNNNNPPTPSAHLHK